jgi:hypothetical protein
MNATQAFVIPGFRREVTGNCAPLGYYAASSGNFLPTFRDVMVPPSEFKNPQKSEDGMDSLSRNVGKNLPLLDVFNLKERGSHNVTLF